MTPLSGKKSRRPGKFKSTPTRPRQITQNPCPPRSCHPSAQREDLLFPTPNTPSSRPKPRRGEVERPLYFAPPRAFPPFVTPAENLLSPVPPAFFLSFPQRICFRPCFPSVIPAFPQGIRLCSCRCLSFCHSEAQPRNLLFRPRPPQPRPLDRSPESAQRRDLHFASCHCKCPMNCHPERSEGPPHLHLLLSPR
jgi:hypothetical protein